MKPTTKDAYNLLHDGSLVLSRIEEAGIRIDTKYLDSSIRKTAKMIKVGEEKLMASSIYNTWVKEYGRKTKLSSRVQLGHIVFKVMGHPCSEFTPGGKPRVTEETLLSVDEPFINNYLRVEKLKKLKNSYLTGIKRETVNGFLHSNYNLHTVPTYRGSCSAPNFQNIPVRDPKAAELIRRCFIPRDNHRLVEIDYSEIEVRILASYHKDPDMIEYIEDPSRDMHRDAASECFMCENEDVTKDLRQCGKNMFVYPQFYGSYYRLCAGKLWDAMERMDLNVGIVPMRIWLKDKGIAQLGNTEAGGAIRKSDYVYHLKLVEDRFWKRFPVFYRWKEIRYAQYRKEGKFSTLTGFTQKGIYSKSDVINHPIQGTSFHCLLWTLIHLHKWLTGTKKKTVIVGQIHDSIVADVRINEFDEYVKVARRIMTEDISLDWSWLIVPLEVGVEACGRGETWNDMKEVEL